MCRVGEQGETMADATDADPLLRDGPMELNQLLGELDEAARALPDSAYELFMASSLADLTQFYRDVVPEPVASLARRTLALLDGAELQLRNVMRGVAREWRAQYDALPPGTPRPVVMLAQTFAMYAAELDEPNAQREAAQALPGVFDSPTWVPTGYGTRRLNYHTPADPNAPGTRMLLALIFRARNIAAS